MSMKNMVNILPQINICAPKNISARVAEVGAPDILQVFTSKVATTRLSYIIY